MHCVLCVRFASVFTHSIRMKCCILKVVLCSLGCLILSWLSQICMNVVMCSNVFVYIVFIIRVICSVFTSCCVSSCICIYCVRSSLHNVICFTCVKCYVCYVSLSCCVRFHICMYVMSASSSAEHSSAVRWALPSIQTHSSLPLYTHIRSNQIWDLYRFQIWGVHGLEFGEKGD